MVTLPSFAQITTTCDQTPDGTQICTQNGSRSPWWWGGTGGPSSAVGSHPWSQGCQSIGCDSSGDDDSWGGDEVCDQYNIDAISIAPKDNFNLKVWFCPTPKEKYCDAKDAMEAFISAVPITGTASTGYGIAESSFEYANITFNAGYQDIQRYLSGDGQHVSPYYTNQNALIKWAVVKVDWNLYDDSWMALGRGFPTISNHGVQHVMAEYFKHMGLGSGQISPNSNLLPPKPAGTSCN